MFDPTSFARFEAITTSTNMMCLMLVAVQMLVGDDSDHIFVCRHEDNLVDGHGVIRIVLVDLIGHQNQFGRIHLVKLTIK